MTHRVALIDEEIQKCVKQLRSMKPPAFLGGMAPKIVFDRAFKKVKICDHEIQIVFHDSLIVNKTGGRSVVLDNETESKTALFKCLMRFEAFKDWCHKFDPAFFHDATMSKITILSVQWFGPNIGFLEFITDLKFKPEFVLKYKALSEAARKPAKDPEIPSIVFMRGASVTILVVITSYEGTKYSILVVQPRAAIGRYNMMELPAGMIDDSNSFGGTAAKEMAEETGIMIKADELVDLTDDMEYDVAYPSCGACDEYMKFFLYKTNMPKEDIEKLKNKCTGAYEEGENIKLKVVPFDRLAEYSPDMKTLSALFLYEQHCKRKNEVYSMYGGKT